MIIVGLCLDDDNSFTSRFFNTKVMQFLGRISMSLYLFHLPLIFYISGFVAYGQENLDKEEFRFVNPAWTIPIYFLLTLLFGTILTWRYGRMKQGVKLVKEA